MSSPPPEQGRVSPAKPQQETVELSSGMGGEAGCATMRPDAVEVAAAAATLPAALAQHPRYRILELIGQGGMGAVYLAEHLVMGRRVAVKTIHTKLVAGPDTVARF